MVEVLKGIVEDRNDPLKLGRCRVRIIGYHTENKTDIPTESLPWATPMQPMTSTGMNGIGESPLGPVEGTTVVIVFNDGVEMQDPMMIGVLGGIPRGANFTTHSDLKTSQENQKAVFNDGKTDDGQKTEPLQKVSETGGRQIDLLIIHCTATKPNHDIGVADVDLWHRQRGWSEIGYHAVIRRNGVIEQGRDLTKRGAHALGYNQRSIGISLVGGVDDKERPENNFTPAQMLSLKTYVQDFLSVTPDAKVIGHNEVSSKACPSFDVQDWLDRVFDNAKVIPEFLDTYDETEQIGGIRLDDTTEPNEDIGETEGFADDITAGTATRNESYAQNGLGFNDPNGVYPKTTHLNEPDTNRWATGDGISNSGNLQTQARPDRLTNAPSFITSGNINIQVPASAYSAQYPFNHVRESESGHLFEVDDTPNAERLLQFHKVGTFEEIHPDGSRVTTIVGSDYTIIDNDGNLHVKGNVNITVDGDANIKTGGKVNLESGGDILAHTDSNFSLTADGRIDITAQGNMRLRGARIDFNP